MTLAMKYSAHCIAFKCKIIENEQLAFIPITSATRIAQFAISDLPGSRINRISVSIVSNSATYSDIVG